MPMTRWEFRIVPFLAGGNASATCLKILVMRFANVPLSLLLHFAAQYKFLVIIRTIFENFIQNWFKIAKNGRVQHISRKSD